MSPRPASQAARRRVANAERDYARETLSLLFGILMQSGYQPRALRKACRDLLNAPPPKPVRQWDPAELAYIADLPHIIAQWHSKSDYLDEDGRPRAIPLEGEAPSLRHLAHSVFPDGDLMTIFRMLLRTRAIRPEGKNFVPTAYRIAYENARAQSFLQALNAVRGVLRTVHHNVTKSRRAALFERTATHPAFPVALLREWNDVVKGLAGPALENWDEVQNVYAARSASRGANGKPATVRAGIGVYFFHDPIRPRARGARRAGKRTEGRRS